MKSSRVACLLDAESGPGAALESKQAIVAIVQKMDNTEKMCIQFLSLQVEK